MPLPLSPAHISAFDTAIDLFKAMTPEQHRQNRGKLHTRTNQPRFAVLNALTEGRRWQLVLTEPRDMQAPESTYEFTLTVYDLTRTTCEADTFQGTPWACCTVVGGALLSVYERASFGITAEHRLWAFCHELLQDVLEKPWEFDHERWEREQRRAALLPDIITHYQVASYDGQGLRELPGRAGVFVSERDGRLARLSSSFQDSLSARYIPAGYTLRQRIGDLTDAIEQGDRCAAFEILDILRAKLGITD